MPHLPASIDTPEQLEDCLSLPYEETVQALRGLDGDIMVLGASGKMGPTVARMAQRAVRQAGQDRKVYAVSRNPSRELAAAGIHTIACDLLDPDAVKELPRAENIIYMVGRKFGSKGAEHLTWATNVLAAGYAAAAFPDARFAAFSTGCVYPVMHIGSGGATEDEPPAPIGEYAQSCLGRERAFDYYSETHGLKVVHLRLNYSVELRYGVLVDIAQKVWEQQPINLTTGYANVIWQGDACNQALQALALADSPARVLNLTGPETISIRRVALEFGKLMDREPVFVGEENGFGYLSNAMRANRLFGNPRVPVGQVILWIAHWFQNQGVLLGKPTQFETQDGQY
ncbi:MAG TPA: NAD-dependent epimerase/dehydratase family protein [Candidatus Sumerlaeota bacterium]|nr:MAG: NAD dependent epimerase/dehydratase family protein [candidate division BRC1 bacterium ADurb.BinA292]HPK02742.1 NAD-dependent epimerase/dehydratase family protein [Candidatus Sumerlaeota bacterium]